jgi:hypothetical protein
MKKTMTQLLCMAVFYLGANAQDATQLVGKKLQVLTNLNSTTTMMGQEVPSEAAITNEFEIKSVADNSAALTGITKRIKVVATEPTGNELTIDSDDPTMKDNPQFAEMFNAINEEKNITVTISKSHIPEDAIGGQNAADVANILFIPISASSKEGTVITSSATADNGSTSTDTLTVTQLTPDEITIQVNSRLVLSKMQQQSGFDVKVNMETTSSAVRVYDVKTGLLKSENKTLSSSGVNEAGGQSFPLSISGTSIITVQ